MATRLNSLCFLLGLVASLTGLSVLGSIVVPQDLTRHFVRFHTGIAIDYNFFPTAHDIRAILDSTANDDSVVTVIVGGTSVFQGASQSEPQIWTELLQARLGKAFRVVNLAQRAGRPNDFGNLAAEMLLRQNRRFIYLCDSMNTQFPIPIEASLYQKTVFDAWQRGELLDWPARDHKMRSALWSPIGTFRENAWEAVIDRYLNFNGLWTYVAFEYGGSVWNKYLALASTRPLREARDGEPSPQWYIERGYPTGEAADQELRLVRRQIVRDPAPFWRFVRTSTDEQFPPALRARMLTVVDLNSPFYLAQISAEERDAFVGEADEMARVIESMGFHRAVVLAKDFEDGDYSDRVHLSVSGGRKLAERVAPEVVKMAQDLGYLP